MKQAFVAKQSHSTKAMPQFLIEAQADVVAGRIDEAMSLLNDQAIESIEKILEVDPDRLDIVFTVAGLFHRARQLDKAEYWYKKVLASEPNPVAYINMGHICHFSGRLSEAIRYRQEAVRLCPDEAPLYHDLGCSLIFAGSKEEGIEMLRKAVEMAPSDPNIHSTFLFRLHHIPELDMPMLFEQHKRWAQIHAPSAEAKTFDNNIPDPDRRLRVGYISPDFRTHPVAYFFESLLDGHDHNAVEIYGYGNVASPDDVTKRLEYKFNHYRNICGLCDEDVVTLIEQDRIDILVDLAGHTPGNCLTTLAHKPAPIAVTYLGYPDTTGMEQIDYRLTDSLVDPPSSQDFYTEELICLPDGFLCYRPPDFAPPVGPLPALRNGCITFGSFNNSSKINSYVISLWAQILNANDKSRFLLKSRAGDDQGVRDIFLRQFEQLGISRDRIEIQGQKPAVEYLRLYDSIDIALDTYPYNGTTTTCDAMWMGVPVITLVGEHHASRVGLSILTRVGLEFFAASTPAELIAKATALAQNLEALVDMRFSMRQRMAASALCNAKAFARNVETAYRKMWHKWCRNRGVEIPNEQLDAEPAVCSSALTQTTANPARQT